VEILICTDGSSSSKKAADIASKFGFAQTTKVTVLAVSEGQDDIKKLTSSLNEINGLLGSKFSVSTKVRHGDPIEEILAEALDHPYDLVIMGGTFSRCTGGHNIIEPALYGKCILCGPHMENFQEVFDLFKSAEALVCTTQENLQQNLAGLLETPEQARAVGARARALVDTHRGASLRIFDAVNSRPCRNHEKLENR
jgi:hypothetical protein